MHNSLIGQVLAFFSMVVAAAEVVVGLAIIVSIFRRRAARANKFGHIDKIVLAAPLVDARYERYLVSLAAFAGRCPGVPL